MSRRETLERRARILALVSLVLCAATFALPGDLPDWLNQITVLLVVGIPTAAVITFVVAQLPREEDRHG